MVVLPDDMDTGIAKLRLDLAAEQKKNGCIEGKQFLKALARTDIIKILAPWASLLALKEAFMGAVVGFVKELGILMAKVKSMIEHDFSVREINEQMGDMETRIAETSKAVAWRSKGDGQDKYPVICEYADEWINYTGYRIRSYFVCICVVLVASKMWPRLHKEIDSTGQRC